MSYCGTYALLTDSVIVNMTLDDCCRGRCRCGCWAVRAGCHSHCRRHCAGNHGLEVGETVI